MANVTNVPFYRPDLTTKDIDAVTRVLQSGWLTTGSIVEQFELKFSELMGGRNVVATNSATGALHLVLIAMGIGAGDGDEVILPTNTFVSDANMVMAVGAKCIFADIDELGNIDTQYIIDNQLINSHTKAIIAVHFGGVPCDMASLATLGIPIIEDCAHALGSEYYPNLMVGVSKHTCVFSFHAIKPLAMGEGGCVVTSDPALAQRIKRLRLHGIDSDARSRYQQNGGWRYDLVELGYKYNPTDLHFAIGLNQLDRLTAQTDRRYNIAEKYDRELPTEYDYVQSYGNNYLYQVMVQDNRRDEFWQWLHAMGVKCSVNFIPIPMFTYYRNLGYDVSKYPNSLSRYNQVLSLPIYSAMSDTDQDFVIDQVVAGVKHGFRIR